MATLVVLPPEIGELMCTYMLRRKWRGCILSLQLVCRKTKRMSDKAMTSLGFSLGPRRREIHAYLRRQEEVGVWMYDTLDE